MPNESKKGKILTTGSGQWITTNLWPTYGMIDRADFKQAYEWYLWLPRPTNNLEFTKYKWICFKVGAV